MISTRGRIGVAVLCAMAVPAIVSAQGMGGFGRGRRIGQLAHEPGIEIPKVVNAVNLMIEHRQELTLSDSQFARVIAIKRTLDSTNASLYRKLDSVQRLFRGGPIFSQPSAARRDSIAEARGVVQESIAAINENDGTARDQAYGLLSVQQLATAQDLEAKAEHALEDEARQSEKGRGRSSGGGGSFGRPPLG